ncbi:MAG: hypothetical protein HY897_10845, partial [Deltaproteobacteria bacterium]|nr:hypothetical protein [Deltaproteobacteria bacterium]
MKTPAKILLWCGGCAVLATITVTVACLHACSGGKAGEEAQPADSGAAPGDAGTTPADTGADAGGADAGDGGVQPHDAGKLEWSAGLPSTADLGLRRGYSIARTIVHLHNIYSHDACDSNPRLEDGSPNEECHAQFRAALCADRIDQAMMTDHYGFVAETDNFEDLYMHRAGDAWEDEGSTHSASIIPCENGHEVRVTVGLEGEASPVGLLRHPV